LDLFGGKGEEWMVWCDENCGFWRDWKTEMVWQVVAVGADGVTRIPGAKRRIQAEGGVNGLLAELWMYQRCETVVGDFSRSRSGGRVMWSNEGAAPLHAWREVEEEEASQPQQRGE
jgi:hypothetical protein